MLPRKILACWIVVLAVLGTTLRSASAQTLSKLDRGRAEQMLQTIANDVEKHYYDPKMHGIDWNTQLAEYKKKLDGATSMNMALSVVAAALDSLNDTHTFFLPPQRPYTHSFGWQIQMIGDRCFVTQVRPRSDAESKGVKLGDQVLSIDGFDLNPENLRKMKYIFNLLRPQPSLSVVLLSPTGQQRQVDITARIRQFKRVMDISGQGDDGDSDIWQLIREEETEDHLLRVRTVKLGEELMVLKLPEFSGFSNSEIWGMLKKARDCKTLVMDLRGDPGGSEDTLSQILSHLFDHDVKIGDRVERKGTKPLMVKHNSHDQFTGKLIVLVDQNSASASELLARVVQIEKRGIVIGDHTAGAVMEAKHYDYTVGTDTVLFYGASITEANIIMTDGKSLEHVGVTPDEIVLPSAADLANSRDPALARAAAIAGVKVDPQDAGKMFPYEWNPDE
jgi:carboxyl-terminal processing protease